MTLILMKDGVINEVYADVYIRYALMPYHAIFVEFCELMRRHDRHTTTTVHPLS